VREPGQSSSSGLYNPAESLVVDPTREGANTRLRLPAASWSFPFLVVLAIAATLFLITTWADIVSSAGSDRPQTFSGLVESLRSQDIEQARNTMGGLGEVMAAVLGLALTVSSIIVQLAATRFTPHVTSLFFRARANLTVLGFFVVSNIFVLWVNFSLGAHFLPGLGVLVSMALLTASLLLLFPYFAYVFYFLEPDSIVTRITGDGLRAATPTKGPNTNRALESRQRRAVVAVEHLANIGLNAIQQKDKNIASSAVNALCHYVVEYEDNKAAMLQNWFTIASWNRESPDFVSLSDDALMDIVARRTWLEWKVLRQYQMLFAESLSAMNDLCYLIAINTRRLGEAAAVHGDHRALDLSIKFFNTYLRATLNAKDIRTAYNILHQYRQLGEFVLAFSHEHPRSVVGDPAVLEKRGGEIAGYMRYYSGIAFGRGLAFLTEVIAHDVGTMCAVAFHAECASHDDLLSTFLTVDETAESTEQETTLRGVRRAQVKRATTYLVHGATSLARRIYEDMIDEPAQRLSSIWNELERLDTREFWEVNDRGTNFDYLTPEQKAQLRVYFSWFEGLEQRPTEASE
jgi:hypothetical protein